MDQKPTLTPSRIAKLLKLDACERYFKFSIEDTGVEELKHNKSEYKEAFKGGAIIEQKAGVEFEEHINQSLTNTVSRIYDLTEPSLSNVAQTIPKLISTELTPSIPHDDIETGEFEIEGVSSSSLYLTEDTQTDQEIDLTEHLNSSVFNIRKEYTRAILSTLLKNNAEEDPFRNTHHTIENISTAPQQTPSQTNPIIVFQPTLTGTIGDWDFGGDADILCIWPTPNSTQNNQDSGPRVRILDVKVANEEQVDHQMQTTIYTTLLDNDPQIDTEPATIEAGIITRKTEITPPTPDTLPTFNIESRTADIIQLTQPNGLLNILYRQSFEDASYQLNNKCASCQFNEACYTSAIENESLELLGINVGTKRILNEHGIDTLTDLATLTEAPPKSEEKITDSDKRKRPQVTGDKKTYAALQNTPTIGDKLPTLIQQAQGLLTQHKSIPQSHSGDPRKITEADNTTLPTDHHLDDESHKSGSMIRVYLNIQEDHIRDCIMGIGAYINATASDTDPITLATLTNNPAKINDEEKIEAEEQELLGTFLTELQDAIAEMGAGIDFSNTQQNHPFLHFYTYTADELRTILTRLAKQESIIKESPQNATQTYNQSEESLCLMKNSATVGTYPTISRADALEKIQLFRSILGASNMSPENFTSTIQEEFTSTYAPQSPTTGLIHIYEQVFPSFSPEDSLQYNEWTYTPTDPTRLEPGQTEINLRSAFFYRLFDKDVPYKADTDGKPQLILEPPTKKPSDREKINALDRYPSRVRQAAQIPLPYMWSAANMITDDWVDQLRENSSTLIISPYRFHSSSNQNTRITAEDTAVLMEKLAHATAHIEQSIEDKLYIKTVANKSPPHPKLKFQRNIETLSNDLRQGNSPTLPEACRNYINTEFDTTIHGKHDYYSNHWQQRIRNGEAILLEISDIKISTDESTRQTIEEITGTLPYDKLTQDDPQKLLSLIRKKGNSGSTTGSFMVATKISKTGDEYAAGDIQTPKPWQIERSPYVTIDTLDTHNRDISLTPIAGTPDEPYVKYASQLQPDSTGFTEDERDLYISEGDWLLLSPASVDFGKSRQQKALTLTEHNETINLFERLLTEDDPENNSTRFDDTTDDIITWMDNEDGLFKPNTAQEGLITNTSSEVTLLQGPPGTGKTSGTLAPAILARAHAITGNNSSRTLVTGPSNKAIDELLEDTHNLLQEYINSDQTPHDLDDTLLIRLADEPQNPLDNVTYTAPHNADDSLTHKIKSRLLQHTNADPPKHIIIFATPTRIWKLPKMLGIEPKPTELIKNIEDTQQTLDSGTSHPFYNGLFDTIVADEASMMNLPSLLLAGMWYNKGGNILISGDHRQLPPIQEHDWKNELNPSITALAPHLSALNFCRLINGESIETFPDELQDLINIPHRDPSNPIIPLHQLEETYRNHTDLATFQEKWVYSRDDLNYYSNQTHTIHPPTTPTTGLEVALNPENVLKVITYDEQQSQQSNRLEAFLARILLEHTDERDSTGVVTPHNAQRGTLEQEFATTPDLLDRTTIDTVERFQGDEQDIMLLSGTVSDPNYIAAESEFLLNLNRLNVAMTRMKKMLLVIASRNIFQHVSIDPEEYNQTLLWKGLAKETGIATETQTTAWTGTLREFVGTNTPIPDSLDPEATIEIYTQQT